MMDRTSWLMFNGALCVSGVWELAWLLSLLPWWQSTPDLVAWVTTEPSALDGVPLWPPYHSLVFIILLVLRALATAQEGGSDGRSSHQS